MQGIARLALVRLVSGLLTILIIVTFVFFMMRVARDPVLAIAGAEPTVEQIAAINERLGLDRPLIVQYGNFLYDTVRLDFGDSFRNGRPAAELVLGRIPATFQLAASALALAVVIAIPVGVLSAVKPGSIFDSISRVAAVFGQSMPVFWLAILLILLFSVNLNWFPTGGIGTWSHLVLPALSLSVYSVPLTMRVTRSAVIEAMNKDYIRTARSKGVSESKVIVRHGLRNGLIPVVTVMALRVGAVMSGTIVLEEVFAYPGLGRLGLAALTTADFPVIQMFIITIAGLTIAINFVADLLYTIVDPRVRIG